MKHTIQHIANITECNFYALMMSDVINTFTSVDVCRKMVYEKTSQYLFFFILCSVGAPVAQLVKRWPTDLADLVRSPLEAKSSRP